MPAPTSSSIMPHPLGNRSSRRHGQGFKMSIARKATKAIAASSTLTPIPWAVTQGSVSGSKVSHIPTNSSHTATPGSGFSGVDIRPVAHTPTPKPATAIASSTMPPMPDPSSSATRDKTRAAAEPAVPGAIGKNPLPNPLPMHHASRSPQAIRPRSGIAQPV